MELHDSTKSVKLFLRRSLAVTLARPSSGFNQQAGASAYNGSCCTTRSWRSTVRESRRQSVRGQPDQRSASGPGSIQVRRPYYNGQDASTLWRPISVSFTAPRRLVAPRRSGTPSVFRKCSRKGRRDRNSITALEQSQCQCHDPLHGQDVQ